MSKAAMERQHLSQADTHIAEAERRIAEQELRLLEQGQARHDATEGERLLGIMRETLEQFHVHRRMIVEALDKAEADEGRTPND